MMDHVFKIVPDSEAEKYFMENINPKCKDGVKVRLGALFGKPWNEYVLTHDDYIRCQKFIKVLKGEA